MATEQYPWIKKEEIEWKDEEVLKERIKSSTFSRATGLKARGITLETKLVVVLCVGQLNEKKG